MQPVDLLGRLIWENWSFIFYFYFFCWFGFGRKITNDFAFQNFCSQSAQHEVTLESLYL